MEIQFDYKKVIKILQIDNAELVNRIKLEISPMRVNPQIWFPNTEIDNLIREFLKEAIQKETYFKRGIHPQNITIVDNNIPIHYVADYYSEKKQEEIISKILNDNKIDIE